MKALTIKQPWVHAILHEGKDVENRSWTRNFRGWLAIHAAATPSRHAVFPRGVTMPDLDELEYSAIVGITRVTDIRTSAKSKWFHKPARGEINYAWILEDVRKLQKPIPCKGALGLWEVSREHCCEDSAPMSGCSLHELTRSGSHRGLIFFSFRK